MNLNVTYDESAINAALDAVLEHGLLCADCAHKIETMAEMSQGDFCEPCRGVVTSQLNAMAEQRIKQELVRRGLPPDAVELAKD